MAITRALSSTGTHSYYAGTTLTFSVPSGGSAGRTMTLVVSARTTKEVSPATTSISTPTGWTLITSVATTASNNNKMLWAFYRVRQAGDTDFTSTRSGDAATFAWVIEEWASVSSFGPIGPTNTRTG